MNKEEIKDIVTLISVNIILTMCIIIFFPLIFILIIMIPFCILYDIINGTDNVIKTKEKIFEGFDKYMDLWSRVLNNFNK